MEKSKIVFLIDDNVRAIEVRYEEGGTTEIFKCLDQTIVVDDLVTVESGTRWNMTVAKVVAVDVEPDLERHIGMRWITGRVDVEAFNEIVAREAKMIEAVQASERRRKKAQLRADLVGDDERLAALEMIEVSVTE